MKEKYPLINNELPPIKGEFIKREYFTPDITDIRVGYECEHRFTDSQEWEKLIIKPTADIQYLKDICDGIIGGAGGLRVPYLTKEQIEAEGWRISVGKDFRVTLFRKDNYTLGYNWEEKSIKIVTFGENSHTLYNGECKDINTFRYITKLLGI